jgi:hypothetical protein
LSSDYFSFIKIKVGDIKITHHFISKFSLITSSSLWDDFLTSRDRSIENKGFFENKVRVGLKK